MSPTEKRVCWAEIDVEILIIGGSLSGLTLALACAHRGIETCVLEQNKARHRGGSALAIDRALLLRTIGLESSHPALASFPIQTNFRRANVWNALYGWLWDTAFSCPEITLVNDFTVSEVMQNSISAAASVNDGRRVEAAVIIGCDGYRSVVRSAIDPEHFSACYAGYTLWRGLISESDLPPQMLLPHSEAGVALFNVAGHRLVAHPVAGPDGSLQSGQRQISFAWYDPTRNTLLQELGCISHDGHVLRTLTREQVAVHLRSDLCRQARNIWPDPWCTSIACALERECVFATPVCEYFPNRIHSGRLAVVGDAAHVVSPLTGRGFVASILDVEALADSLQEAMCSPNADLSSALDKYSKSRLREGQKLVQESFKLSRAYLDRAGDCCFLQKNR